MLGGYGSPLFCPSFLSAFGFCIRLSLGSDEMPRIEYLLSSGGVGRVSLSHTQICFLQPNNISFGFEALSDLDGPLRFKKNYTILVFIVDNRWVWYVIAS